jgi:hypothetical protein
VKKTANGWKVRVIPWALVTAFTVCGSQPVLAKSPNGGESPTAVVREYCQLDMEGGRLSGQNPYVNTMFSLVAWPDEPGWDSAIVVKRFAIVGSHAGQPGPTVTVRYTLLAKMTGANLSRSEKPYEVVTFVLAKSGGGWKIQRPMIPPHVSVEAAKAALRGLLTDEKNPRRRVRLRHALALLQRWDSGTSDRIRGLP